ncbi:MAG: EamA family transporter RarD [Actinomycetota bacterium]
MTDSGTPASVTGLRFPFTILGGILEHRRGIWLGIAAYAFWGLTPIFWNLVVADAASLLLHRIVWSVPLLVLIVTVRRQWVVFRDGYTTWRPRFTTMAAAGLLSINWGTYVWAVTSGHILEASLGYFINPLVSVALGVAVLRERLSQLSWTAVGIAAVGVTTMGILTGVPPWISLILASSFGTYGLLKKHDVTPPPVVSLLGETLVLFPPAMIALVFVIQPTGATFTTSPGAALFFIGAGAVTVIPLLAFGGAAKRIPLSTLGFLQYIAPTLQLIVGLTVFGESLTMAELTGFVIVWIALAIFAVDQARSPRVALIPDT